MPPHFDWEHKRVFPGYDPIDDGFAYPAPDCTCTQDPTSPHNAILCDYCIDLLEKLGI